MKVIKTAYLDMNTPDDFCGHLNEVRDGLVEVGNLYRICTAFQADYGGFIGAITCCKIVEEGCSIQGSG